MGKSGYLKSEDFTWRKIRKYKCNIEGMQVKGISGDGNWLILPKLYARKDLPVDKEEIVAPEKITEWEYLKSIIKEIVQKDYVCIRLLIGAN